MARASTEDKTQHMLMGVSEYESVVEEAAQASSCRPSWENERRSSIVTRRVDKGDTTGRLRKSTVVLHGRHGSLWKRIWAQLGLFRIEEENETINRAREPKQRF